MLVAATRLTGPDRDARPGAGGQLERAPGGVHLRLRATRSTRPSAPTGTTSGSGCPAAGASTLRNQPQGTQPVDAAALVGLEFGYLPRLGLRDPADKRITDTLAIVEAMLGADTPSGRAYHRYDIDGYGEWLDGSGWPVRKFGIGRPWPLLAGERGHLDVLAGGDANSPAAGDAGHARPRRPAARADLGRRPAPLAEPAAGPAHRQRDAAGLGAQRADQARGGGRHGQAGRAAHPGQRPVPRGRARLADLVLARLQPGPGAARGADPGGGGPGAVHPALRVRRLGPGHDHRTGRAAASASACSGSPSPRPTWPGGPACSSCAATRTAAGKPPPATTSRWALPGRPPCGCQPPTPRLAARVPAADNRVP